MRIGENPQKFARKNPELARLQFKVPRPLTLTTVTYVPHLLGYYQSGLDILKLVFSSIQKSVREPSDLMVFDNGSCPEVIDYLTALNRSDVIQWLFLSSRNMKKIGAWSIMFPAAPGELVYYFDSDIYHYPGWFESSRAILEAFPGAGIVNAFPFLGTRQKEQTLELAARDPEISVDHGSFVDPSILREMAEGLGSDPDSYVEKKMQGDQIRLRARGAAALVSASHCQFLTQGGLLRRIFPRDPEWAVKNSEKDFDELVSNHGYMHLSTVEGHIYHLGNTLTPKWRQKAGQECVSLDSTGENELRPMPRNIRRILGIGPVRAVLLWLYGLFFRLLYGAR